MGKASITALRKRGFNVLTVITLILLVVSVLWIFFDLYAYLEIRARSKHIDYLSSFMDAGFIIQIVLYFSFAFMLFSAFRKGVRPDSLIILSIITGVLSAISLVFDFAALDDIGVDYLESGYDCTMEWTWLFGSLFLHLLFYALGIILIIRMLKREASLVQAAEHAVDETVFEISQYVGIICGLTGFIFASYASIALHDFVMKDWINRLLTFYCLIIILPYFSVIVYWLVRAAGKHQNRIYDEKQKKDIAQAGLTAWLVSLPLMALLFVVSLVKGSSAAMFLWFPFYLFATLLVFSVTLLIRFKKG